MNIDGTNFNIRSLNGLQKYLKEQGITYPAIKSQLSDIC